MLCSLYNNSSLQTTALHPELLRAIYRLTITPSSLPLPPSPRPLSPSPNPGPSPCCFISLPPSAPPSPLATSFCFKDQYLELTTSLPEDADLYGLGEASLPTGMLLPRNGTIITLWNRDIGSNTAWANLYSSHPFYLQVDGGKRGWGWGVFKLWE
jgi:hypothetical protein